MTAALLSQLRVIDFIAIEREALQRCVLVSAVQRMEG
jgi:hypothetical protein